MLARMTYFDIDALRHGFSFRDILDESWSHGLGEVHLVIGDVELYLGVALGAHPAPVPGDGDVSSAGVPGGHRGIMLRLGLQCHLVPHAAGHAKAIPLGHEAPVRAWHVLLRQDGFSEVRGASVVGQDVGAGGCGGVVGVGVVDLDVVDGGGEASAGTLGRAGEALLSTVKRLVYPRGQGYLIVLRDRHGAAVLGAQWMLLLYPLVQCPTSAPQC